jgi:hypothetical protein
MALDTALETLTDGSTSYVDFLPFGKNRDRNLITRLERGQLISIDTEFLEDVPGFHARLGQMASNGLGNARGTALADAT